jgi:hypothetical protein
MLPSPALALAIGPIEKPPRILDICISRALTNTLPGAEQMAVVAIGTVCSAPRCSLCRRPGRWLWVVRRYTPSQPPFSPSKPSHHGVYPRAWKTSSAIAGRAAISWSDRTEHREYPRLRECGHLGVVSGPDLEIEGADGPRVVGPCRTASQRRSALVKPGIDSK